jgi:WD40 repeat protein
LQAPDPVATARSISVNVELAAVAPNSRWLATSDSHAVQLWDLTAPNPAAITVLLDGSDQNLSELLFTPSSLHILTRGADKTLRWWDVRPVGSSGRK